MSQGHFITLEGSEGAGKSTNVDTVCEMLDEAGITFYRTREPGGTDLAEALRKLMLAEWEETIDGMTEALIVFAARNQHLKTEIVPRLERGDWVVCDRFTDATFAYQGAGRGVDTRFLEALEQTIQGTLQPDLTLFLDVPPALAEKRIAGRSKDRMEKEEQEFFDRVRQGYLTRANKHPRMKIVDATQALDHVRAQVREILGNYLGSVNV